MILKSEIRAQRLKKYRSGLTDENNRSTVVGAAVAAGVASAAAAGVWWSQEATERPETKQFVNDAVGAETSKEELVLTNPYWSPTGLLDLDLDVVSLWLETWSLIDAAGTMTYKALRSWYGWDDVDHLPFLSKEIDEYWANRTDNTISMHEAETGNIPVVTPWEGIKSFLGVIPFYSLVQEKQYVDKVEEAMLTTNKILQLKADSEGASIDAIRDAFFIDAEIVVQERDDGLVDVYWHSSNN